MRRWRQLGVARRGATLGGSLKSCFTETQRITVDLKENVCAAVNISWTLLMAEMMTALALG